MGKLKTVLTFIIGAATGGVGVWYYLKNRYDEQVSEDIASAKEAFRNHEKKLQNEIDDLKKQLLTDNDNESASPTILTSDKVQDKEDVVNYIRGKYQMYNPEPIAKRQPDSAQTVKNDYTSRNSANDIEAPYVISPDEFGEMDDYNQVSLTYYTDGILADEYGVIVDNIEEMVGDSLEHFGEYEDDSVFCRSDAKKCDYEILKDLRRYADVRKSFPPNI